MMKTYYWTAEGEHLLIVPNYGKSLSKACSPIKYVSFMYGTGVYCLYDEVYSKVIMIKTSIF